MQPFNPIQAALGGLQNGNNAAPASSMMGGDYHILMSNWMHNQVNSGAWNKMSGKDIVNAFQKQSGVINNIISQKAQQASSQFQQLSQPPQITGSPILPQMNF